MVRWWLQYRPIPVWTSSPAAALWLPLQCGYLAVVIYTVGVFYHHDGIVYYDAPVQRAEQRIHNKIEVPSVPTIKSAAGKNKNATKHSAVHQRYKEGIDHTHKNMRMSNTRIKPMTMVLTSSWNEVAACLSGHQWSRCWGHWARSWPFISSMSFYLGCTFDEFHPLFLRC